MAGTDVLNGVQGNELPLPHLFQFKVAIFVDTEYYFTVHFYTFSFKIEIILAISYSITGCYKV